MRTPRKPRFGSARRELDPLDSRAARAAALDALSRRDHSSEELRGKLLGKGYDAGVVAELVDRLRTEKLLDDGRYLENFVAYHAGRGQGPNRVRANLRQLGLAGAEIDAALAGYPDWLTQLKRAREKEVWSFAAGQLRRPAAPSSIPGLPRIHRRADSRGIGL